MDVLFLLICIDEKDAEFPAARKERDVCRENLSRVNTIGSADYCVLRTQQSGACLETGLLLPPLAAQRLFPLLFNKKPPQAGDLRSKSKVLQ